VAAQAAADSQAEAILHLWEAIRRVAEAKEAPEEVVEVVRLSLDVFTDPPQPSRTFQQSTVKRMGQSAPHALVPLPKRSKRHPIDLFF
jgi:hypothetical protein